MPQVLLQNLYVSSITVVTYEKYIRKAAGLGSTPTAPDVDEYDKMNHHCDVLIVGGGFAGLTAAKNWSGKGSESSW